MEHPSSRWTKYNQLPKIVLHVEKDGTNCLYWPAFYGYLEIINELLAHGVPLDVGGKNGYTPLHAASLRGQLGALRLLLNAGADPSLKNEHGDTARDCGDDEVKTFFDNYPNIDENILETKAMTERKQASKLPPRFYFPI
ncbi:hypothetical protein Ae201684P_012307 [Aphanomyces euteiches]|uniref:Uncharacterized protein n=1 Tax=Aphanomyces euteiches TaxID=100861 RepID=A0A6G0W4J4_9STRA|nr:hypothetical protein Ae201684_018778 [Aphanomyces euteiches]KAH9089021.1 hypothetical protein Ae201684P_012307 [Aphanomyces euteiches]